MRRSGIVLLREFLVTQLNFWALFPAAFLLQTLIRGGNHAAGILSLLPMGLLPFFFYLFRRYLQKPLLFLAAHAGVLAGIFLWPGPDGVTHGIYLFWTIGFIGYSFYLRLHDGMWEDRNLPPVFSAVLAGICLSILQHFGQGGWKYLIYASLILVLSLYFPMTYIENYLNFLLVNTSSASHIPEREIFTSGIRLTAGYTLAGAVILMSVADIAWFRNVLRLFLLGLRGILMLLFYFIPQGEAPEEESAWEPAQGGGSGLPIPEGDGFWLWDVIGYMVFGLFLLALCVTLWKKLRFLVGIMRKRWGIRFRGEETAVFLDETDEREKIAPVRRGKKRVGRVLGFLSIEEQIRRLYRRRAMQAQPDMGKLKRMTARECAEKLRTPELAAVYEKARYSGLPCGRADLKEMKAYVRQTGIVG